MNGAAAVAPAASYTVVAGDGARPEPPAPAARRRSERRSPQRRLHDAAVRTLLAGRQTLLGALAVAFVLLLVAAWPVHGWAVPALALGALAALALLSGRAWAVRDTRRLQRRLVLLVGALLLLPASTPWLAFTPPLAAAAAWPLALALVGCAFVGACLLAPLRPLATAAALLPLSLAPAVEPELTLQMSMLAAAAAAVVVALAGHRRWRRTTQLLLQQDGQLRALEAERDAAISADQEKSRFLAIASHDLRQPVHAIGLFAATLDKRLQGSADEPLVRNLSRAIDGLDRSFNVMLDISRLDAGAVEPRLQQFPLRDLFRRLHMHYAGQAEQKGLGLRFSPGGKSICSDPQLIERVLGNLLQNAIRYTDRGGIVVVARSTASHVNVEVWDTGVGIGGADLPRVFDEYFQVGRGPRMRTQGLGMGLAIVKRLVQLLGHRLTVASRPGRGTVFRLSVARGGLAEMQDMAAAADTVPLTNLQPRTVLVIDDEEPIRAGLCGLLHAWGFDAVGAASLDTALQALHGLDLPPDLILSDLHLGDGPDGIAVIDAVRAACGGDVAAMLVTGDTSHAEIRRATDSGHPVLFKPVQPRKLYDALRGLAS